MNFSQASPKVMKVLLKEKVLLLYPPNLDNIVILSVLPKSVNMLFGGGSKNG